MTRNRIHIIGITGNSGSGKSTAAHILEEYGADVLDADKTAHNVMCRPKPAFMQIVEAFGTEILGSGGEIDRKKLGRIVFADEKKRTLLEEIVHPQVESAVKQWLESFNPAASMGVIDAVLLIESGLHLYCDSVWLITAPEEIRCERIINRDALTAEAAEARMRNQRNIEKLIPYADTVIHNGGSIGDLREKVARELKEMRIVNGL